MFWTRFYELCDDMGLKPNPVAKELGISSGALTKWKKGISYPNGEILINIAKYFDCSLDYLVGLSEQKKSCECEIAYNDLKMLEKLHALPQDSQEEILYMINYKYDKHKNKEAEISSPSTSRKKHNLLA